MRRRTPVAMALLVAIALLAACGSGGSGSPGDPAPLTPFVVAPQGDDAAAGTAEQPFRTLTRARDAVRARLAEGPDGPLEVLLRGGRYHLTAPLELNERDSGRVGSPVVYRSWPGEQAVLVGGRPVTGWRPGPAGLYVADLRPGWQPNALAEDGVAGVMARAPDAGYFAVENVPVNAGGLQLTYAAGDLPALSDASRAQVVVWGGYDELWDGGKNYDWEASLCPVAAADAATRTLTLTSPPIRPLHAGNRWCLRGARELLDAPGEFWVDAAAAQLWYRPRQLPIEAQQIEAASTTRILSIVGASPSSPAQHLRFEGLTFTLTSAPDAFLVADYLACDGMVYLGNAEHVTFAGCRLLQAGASALAIDGHNRSHTVRDCLVDGAGLHGVALRGWWVGTPPPPPAQPDGNREHVITSCCIRRCARLIGHSSGIWLYQSGHNEVSRNLFEELPRSAVLLLGASYGTLLAPLDEGGAGGVIGGVAVTWENHLDFLHTRANRIVDNEIRDVMRDSQDAGAITAYGTGAGNRIAGNFVHHIRSAVTEGAHAGIYLDDASNLFAVERNVVARMVDSRYVFPLVVKGYDNVVTDNVIADNEAFVAVYVLQTPNAGLPPDETHPEELTDRVRLERNVVYRSGGNVYMVFPWTPTIVATSDANVLWNPAGWYGCSVAGTWEPWSAWCARDGGRLDAATLLTDPLLLDADALDFCLAPGAPGWGLGHGSIDVRAAGLPSGFPFAAEIGSGVFGW